jgi:glycosyltransferase involved in cell wall biosynthesis
VLFLTKYARNGASSRYRTFQYVPWLDRARIQYTLLELFDEDYLAYKYARGHAHPAAVLRAFIRRLLVVLTLPRHSTVVTEYELLPYFPALPERWLVWRGCRLVVDYDDALFHQYDNHRKKWVRRLFGRKIATVMRLAHTVVAGNPYLAEYARRAGAPRVEVIPTVVDLDRYPSRDAKAPDLVAPFVIGWIGSPSTARYLETITPALAEICANGRACVRLIGSGPINLAGVPVEVLAWDENSEVDMLKDFDVGIMPLPDEPWERGKCGFKLIQYMACGLPVVASPVGVNREIVEHDVNGYLAVTTTEWVRMLNLLLDDADLRQRLGQAGRAKVEREYSLQVTGPKLAALIKAVVGGEAG